MTENKTICLLNDSFPPQIDGVANTVLNYAKHIPKSGYQPMVITPSHPDAKDENFSYPILRYPSVNFRKMEAYQAGIPFSPEIAGKASDANTVLLHSHCPIISTLMARQLRQVVRAPIVLTYHTKFDVDIANVIKHKMLQQASIKALVSNISACDEVWVVSKGAGDNLHSLGYEKDCIVMPNGVDLPRGRVSNEQIVKACNRYDLPQGVPVFLFVGRMMWYKGIRLILDALTALARAGSNFRMVFIGSGDDSEEIRTYAVAGGIADRCIFTGPIRDREILRAWYCRADLFLFPSSYDTNGLVVREAAACDLASVLIKDSCASEDIIDGQNGFLIEEKAEDLALRLYQLSNVPHKMHAVGKTAADEIYLSWEDAVAHASKRYEIVYERYQSGGYAKIINPTEGIMKLNGELMEGLYNIWSRIQNK